MRCAVAIKADSLPTTTERHPQFGYECEYIPADALHECGLAPTELPPYWRISTVGIDGIAWTYQPPYGRRFKVLMSAERELDGKLWLHVSLSKWNQSGKTEEEPTWADIRNIKDLFIGPLRKAIVILPPEKQYVNICEVHHLWCCLANDPLPDFTHGFGSI